MLVIVTRPANAGQRLFERLVAHGFRACWLPAFDIGEAPDPLRARELLGRLSDYDVAIFVSASAVRATRRLLSVRWPSGTLIGAVGAATRAAIEAELDPPAGVVISALENDRQPGSEAFWDAWQATNRRAHRVLLIRAQDGRNWLSERFKEQGARVDTVAAYSRHLHRLSAAELLNLQKSIVAGTCPATVFSSTEAVAAIDRQVDSVVQTWLRNGIAIACHPRIGERLLANGYARVLNATFDDDSIVARLESIGVRPQAS